MELRAELTGRDGQRQPLRVRCEPEPGAGAGGQLRALRWGLAQLQEQVSALLGPLVQQESGAGPRGDNEDEDQEENSVDKTCADEPPLKRTKIQHS
uniref:GON7 subunit of KEOPS complex n=1 Tax=Crocodylus porosus TaxID=8502 RepID=A0A7M4EP60_CROPO